MHSAFQSAPYEVRRLGFPCPVASFHLLLGFCNFSYLERKVNYEFLEKLGDATVMYTGKWDKYLASTPYGQMVLTLDFTNRLGKLGKSSASIYAVKNFE